jgi:hypothetical protein
MNLSEAHHEATLLAFLKGLGLDAYYETLRKEEIRVTDMTSGAITWRDLGKLGIPLGPTVQMLDAAGAPKPEKEEEEESKSPEQKDERTD